MKLEVGLLVLLAVVTQLMLAARHGFEPVEDGLQVASAGTLVLLVIIASRARVRKRKALVLQILDELGQPLTVFQGYLSMLSDGTLSTLDGRYDVLKAKSEEMRQMVRRLVAVVRESGW
jgi:hypothetical protein